MDSQNLLFAFVQAEEARKHLQSKLIEVEDNFVMQQAILGWIVDNPWIMALLLQREVHRLDVPQRSTIPDSSAQAEIDRLKTELEAARAVPGKIWTALKNDLCKPEVKVELLEGGDVNIAYMQVFVDKARWKEESEFKEGFLTQLKSYFTAAGVNGETLALCTPQTGGADKKAVPKTSK